MECLFSSPWHITLLISFLPPEENLVVFKKHWLNNHFLEERDHLSYDFFFFSFLGSSLPEAALQSQGRQAGPRTGGHVPRHGAGTQRPGGGPTLQSKSYVSSLSPASRSFLMCAYRCVNLWSVSLRTPMERAISSLFCFSWRRIKNAIKQLYFVWIHH